IDLIFRKSVFDRDVAAFDITGFTQATTKRISQIGPVILPKACQEADESQIRLLSERGPRPHRNAAQRRNELAPPHSITSSARPSMVGGTTMLSAFAVFTLITIL